MDARTKALLEKAEWFANPEVIGQGSGASDAAEMILALRLAVKEQDKRARHAEQERDLYDQRISELEAEVADVRERQSFVEKMRHKERQTWASHSSCWALFHEDPDAWLPYVESTLHSLTEFGVPENIIKSMTPFPDAADRIRTKNALVQHIAQDRLRQAMSELSEECWCAGWLMGTEFSLWRFVQNGPGEWGQGVIKQSDIDELKFLAEVCKGWYVWDNANGETFVPTMKWLEAFEEHEKR
jgi:hypothetical protein